MSVADTDTGAIRGWGCTPTGDSPAATSDEQTIPTCLPTSLHRGWRRTALYCIIIFLMITVFVNLGLTLWIISVLRLSVVSTFSTLSLYRLSSSSSQVQSNYKFYYLAGRCWFYQNSKRWYTSGGSSMDHEQPRSINNYIAARSAHHPTLAPQFQHTRLRA